MGASTEIAWTDATWNPIRGCTRVSAGCENCYAESVAARFSGPGQPYEGLATKVNGHARWTNTVRFIPEHINDPLRWQKPRRVFVNSMSDLFHEQVTDAMLWDILGVIWVARRHTFQVLTKRPQAMHDAMQRWYARPDCVDPLIGNLWLGTSVENQRAADERIPWLISTPAAVRFLSCEPLLGPVDLTRIPMIPERFREADDPECSLNALTGLVAGPDDVLPALNWVIVGGESGPNHRPMDIKWLERIVTDCKQNGVAVFVKQDSGRLPGKQGRIPDELFIREFPQTAVAV